MVAWSGGLDSSVLLYACIAAGLRVQAVHVNHGLQAAASQFEQHCLNVADTLTVPLQVCRLEGLPREGSVETFAREARYKAIFSWMQSCSFEHLVLAHHRLDQAETILMQLLRGSGFRGVAGMAAEGPPGVQINSSDSSIRLHRPLLSFSKSDLLEYAKAHSIQFVEDPTNEDDSIRRNWLRNQIIPELLDKYPQTEQSLLKLGQFMAEYHLVLENLAADLFGKVCESEEKLDLGKWSGLQSESRREVLRYWLGKSGVRCGREKLIELERQLAEANSGGYRQVAKGWKLRISRKIATIEKE